MTQRDGRVADCIMGVDPGVSGAVAFLFLGDMDLMVIDLPVADGQVDAISLARIVSNMNPTMAIIEKVHSMPKQGVASTFKFGLAYGMVIGVVDASKIPLRFVAPSVWKKEFGLGPDKEQARALALRLWPDHLECFAKKKDHGKAEAALIARYGLQILLKERNKAA
jgi:Holliday junction resolvasome RuvABC endonuclease subunit